VGAGVISLMTFVFTANSATFLWTWTVILLVAMVLASIGHIALLSYSIR